MVSKKKNMAMIEFFSLFSWSWVFPLWSLALHVILKTTRVFAWITYVLFFWMLWIRLKSFYPNPSSIEEFNYIQVQKMGQEILVRKPAWTPEKEKKENNFHFSTTLDELNSWTGFFFFFLIFWLVDTEMFCFSSLG